MPFPDDAPVPPAARRRSRRGPAGWLLAALLSAALAAGLGVAAAHHYAARSSPESVVRDYFQALAGGDAPAALAFADAPPHGQFLTSVVLQQQRQVARLADISVLPAITSGATATVEVHYRLLFGAGARSVSDTARLVRRGSVWRMSRVAGTVSLAAGSPVAGRVRLAGQQLPAAAVLLFPGALPLAADPPSLQVLAASRGADQPIIRLADPHLAVKAQVSLSPQLRAQVVRATQTLLAGCLARGSHDPLCPVPDSGRTVPGSLHGSAPSIASVNPRVELDPTASGVIDLRAAVSVEGSWQAWDFENQVVARDGTATVVLDAQIFLDRPTRAFWNPSE